MICNKCYQRVTKWRSLYAEQADVYAMLMVAAPDLPVTRQRHRPARDVVRMAFSTHTCPQSSQSFTFQVRLTFTNEKGRPETALIADAQVITLPLCNHTMFRSDVPLCVSLAHQNCASPR